MPTDAPPRVSFSQTIRPYFTKNDRDLMMDKKHTGRFTLDLWDLEDVKKHFGKVRSEINSGSMPPPGHGPWSKDKIAKFIGEFDAWRVGGFAP